MSETTNPFSYSNYIEIDKGSIHKDYIPYVIDEPVKYKLSKAVVFYSIFIVLFILVIYITYTYEHHKKLIKDIKKSHLDALSITPQKIPAIAEVSKVRVFNFTQPIPIEHIVLVDINNNIIDVDIKYNYFVKSYNVGPDNQGKLFDIDFGSPQTIKEIMINIDPDKVQLNSSEGKGVYITLELYNGDKKTWQYSGVLSKKENSVRIYKEVYKPINQYERKLDMINQMELLSNSGTNREITIFNENALAIKLRELDEDYDSY